MSEPPPTPVAPTTKPTSAPLSMNCKITGTTPGTCQTGAVPPVRAQGGHAGNTRWEHAQCRRACKNRQPTALGASVERNVGYACMRQRYKRTAQGARTRSDAMLAQPNARDVFMDIRPGRFHGGAAYGGADGG